MGTYMKRKLNYSFKMRAYVTKSALLGDFSVRPSCAVLLLKQGYLVIAVLKDLVWPFLNVQAELLLHCNSGPSEFVDCFFGE